VAITSTSGQGTAANHHFITLPSSAAGDRMLLLLSFDNGPDINVSGAFDMIMNEIGYDYAHKLAIYHRVTDGTEPEAITLQLVPAVNEDIAWMVLVVDNPNLASGVTSSTTSAAQNSANPDPGSVTAPWGAEAGNLFIAIAAWDNVSTLTSPPSGYTTWSGSSVQTSGTGCGIAFGAKVANSATDDPGTFTISAAEQVMSRTLVIRTS